MAIFADASAWLDALRDDPEMRIDHLLRQWDAISPFERDGGGDSLAWSLKAHGTTGDAALVDHGLAQWLKARVMEPLPVVLDTGWNAYVTDLIEAFSLAARLPMPETGALLRSR